MAKPNLTRIEVFSIITMMFLGCAVIIFDFLLLRETHNFSISFLSSADKKEVSHFGRYLIDNCVKSNIEQALHFTKFDGFDCNFTPEQEKKIDGLSDVIVQRSHSYLSGKTGFLFLFSGIWSAFVGVMLSLKILKGNDE